jgi:hypothetical protein
MDSCCDVSQQLAEPVEGSALPGVVRWLMIEVSGAWAAKTTDAPGLAGPIRAHIEAAMTHMTGCRLQLVRRPGERSKVRVMAATVGGGVFAVELPSLDALLSLDILALFEGAGDAVEEPVVLVCTHGVRDVCCAREGAPVFKGLEAQGVQNLWQTTHLGGHRFAATLVVLPAGLQFGRVTASEVPDLVAELSAGRVYRLDRFRGCTALSREAQVIDAHLRKSHDLRTISAVQCRGMQDDALAFEVNGRAVLARVQSTPDPRPRPVSCATTTLKNPPVYSVSASE